MADDDDNLDDLDLGLDLNGDDDGLLPSFAPARRPDVMSALEAQNKVLRMVIKRQEKIVRIYGEKLKYLMEKEKYRERDQKFYKQLASIVGAVFIALIGYFVSTITTFFKHSSP